MSDLINTYLGQYQLIEAIGHGGMATVYKAYQPSLERFVAVKVLLSNRDPQFAVRFKREARAIAALQHHNILPIYDYGEQDGLLYFVLQYVENGLTLHDQLGAPLAPAQALRLIGHVLAALEYAHARGVIHRDLKPANILLPAPNWALLADFGIAKLLNDSQHLTMTGFIIGTAAYMAPEQAAGRPIDARTDLYSLGVVLYEMLTGRVPFDSDTPMAVLTKHVYEAPPPPRTLNPNLPPALEAMLLRALAKDPAARYQSAGEMAEDVERVAAQFERPRPPSQVHGLYRAGVEAFQRGQWDEAVTQFERLVAFAPDYEDAAMLLNAARVAREQVLIATTGQQRAVAQPAAPDSAPALPPAPVLAPPTQLKPQPEPASTTAGASAVWSMPASAAQATAPTPAAALPAPAQRRRIGIWLAFVAALLLCGAGGFFARQIFGSSANPAVVPATAASATPTPSATPSPSPSATPTPSASPTASPAPTNTPAPSATPEPSATAVPTDTPKPTPKPTVKPTPRPAPPPTAIPPTDTPVPPTAAPPTDTPVPPTDTPTETPTEKAKKPITPTRVGG